MRRKTIACSLALSVLGCALVMPYSARYGSASAATTLKGQGLVINTPCLSGLTVTSNTALPGSVQIMQALPAGVTATLGKNGVISVSQQGCTATSTLGPKLVVATRPDLPLTIEDAGRTAVMLADRTGTVFMRTGSAPAEMGKAGELGLISASSGPVTIRTLSDSARIRSEVAAPIIIKAITAPAIALYLGGTATFTGQSGHLQALEITSASTGNAVLHGTTDVGVFHTLSSGNIVVDAVKGTLATERDGSGQIIANAAQPPAPDHATRVTAIPDKD